MGVNSNPLNIKGRKKELHDVSRPRRRIPYLKFINGVLKLCQLKGNKMPSISILKLSIPPPKLSYSPRFLIPTNPSTLINFPHCPHLFLTSRKPLLCSKEEEAEVSKGEDEWLQKLPDKNKPLYSHSLPCLEAWLKKLGFCQSKEDRAVWFVEKPDWHAQLSLDVTDLYIRYVKNGPGNLEKDVERRFSYALSRDDIENAILGGP